MIKVMHGISRLALCGLMILSGCGSDESDKAKLTDQQKATQALKDGSPWIISSVDSKPEGADEEMLNDFELSFGVTGKHATIAPGSFSSEGLNDALASGPGAIWSWNGDGYTNIKLTGGFAPELTDIVFNPGIENPTTMTVTFVLPAYGGRVKGAGEYTITFE